MSIHESAIESYCNLRFVGYLWVLTLWFYITAQLTCLELFLLKRQGKLLANWKICTYISLASCAQLMLYLIIRLLLQWKSLFIVLIEKSHKYFFVGSPHEILSFPSLNCILRSRCRCWWSGYFRSISMCVRLHKSFTSYCNTVSDFHFDGLE